MLVKISGECGSETEWCLLEFQGELLGCLEPNAAVGDLELKGSDVTMVIGQHLLDGKVIKMQKPFLIVETKEGGELQTAGVVRKKIMFKTRPKPKGITK